MKFDPAMPYNTLPLLPPKADIESKATLKKCITANRALAELKGVGELIPNQTILINSIPLQEAKFSSEIENIVTTNDLLYRAAASPDSRTDPQTKEVLHYRAALKKGCDLIAKKPLSTNVIIDVCSCLLDRQITVRKIPGTCVANPTSKEVIYTPPTGEAVIRDKLGDLERFIHADDIFDPLVRLAITHYQFEAIHPFHDGNGRTGRILNILYLIENKLLDIPVLYLSRYIIENKKQYYSLLRGVTEKQDWEPWILYMLDAVEVTAIQTTNKIRRIYGLLEETVEFCKKNLPVGIYSKELIEMIFIQPYCKIKFLVDADIAKRQTASKYLQELERVGVIAQTRAGREVIYINPKLVKLLSE
ncbi:MAG: Fic family protein [Sedimentisphaerales bacterium]|nr:Fic family protein [Sedimentisphaerales bacterium]